MSDVVQGEVAESSLPTQRKRERAGVSLSLCFDTWQRVGGLASCFQTKCMMQGAKDERLMRGNLDEIY